MSSLALAHIDAVYEILVRAGSMYPRAGHLRQPPSGDSGHGPGRGPGGGGVRKIVPLLTDEEEAVYRRGRNAQVHSIPKTPAGPVRPGHCPGGAAGLALLQGRLERINELFGIILDESDETDEKG